MPAPLLPAAVLLWATGVLADDARSAERAWDAAARVASATPITVLLVAAALLAGSALGTALGCGAALRPRSALGLAGIAMAAPAPWLPGFLPATLLAAVTDGGPADTALALLALTLPVAWAAARIGWKRLEHALAAPPFLAARSRGLALHPAVTRHALPAALAAVAAGLGRIGADLLIAAAAAETLFGLPGLGELLVSAARNGDHGTAAAAFAALCGLGLLVALVGRLLAHRIAPGQTP